MIIGNGIVFLAKKTATLITRAADGTANPCTTGATPCAHS